MKPIVSHTCKHISIITVCNNLHVSLTEIDCVVCQPSAFRFAIGTS